MRRAAPSRLRPRGPASPSRGLPQSPEPARPRIERTQSTGPFPWAADGEHRHPAQAIAELAGMGRYLMDQRGKFEHLAKAAIAWYCRYFNWPTGRIAVLQDDLPRGISYSRNTPVGRHLASLAADEISLNRLRLWEDLIAFRTPVAYRTIPVHLQPGIAGSAFGIPMLMDDEVLGVLEFFSDELRAPDETAVDAARFLSWLLVQSVRSGANRTADRRGDPALRLAFDQAPVAVALIHAQTLLISRLSPGFLRLLGREPEEVIGKPISQFLHREDIHALAACLTGSLTPEIRPREFRFIRKDGRYLWIRAILSSPSRRFGADLVTVFMGEDVTEEMKISRVLRETEARHEAAMEASQDPFFLISSDGRIRDGRARPDSVPRRLDDLFAPDVADAYRIELAVALKTRQVREFTYIVPDARGEREHSVRLVAAGDSEALAVVRDITGQRHLERRLHEAEERQRRKLGQALHDGLGQDLTGIALKCSALARRLGRVSKVESSEARLIEKLVQSALASSRAIARGLCPVGLEGCGLAEHLVKMARQVSETFGVSCTVDWHEGLPDSTGAQVSECYWIIHEAVTNALRHGSPKSIRISASPDAGGARFRVWNDGRPLEIGQATGGMGLEIMRSRAHSVGAALSIANCPAGGVELLFCMPIWGSPAPDATVIPGSDGALTDPAE